MIPFDSLIQLERNSSVALFVQLANQLIGLIKQGHLAVGTPLPSSRVLAETLGVHRKTIVAAYDELILQGWVETIPKKGTFVAFDIPQLQGSGKRMKTSAKVSTTPNFDWCSDPRLMPFKVKAHLKYHIDDGVSDSRWSPNALLGKLYRQVLLDPTLPDLMGYGDPKGNQYLREVLVGYLNETRGLGISTKNILITRGSQMGIHLSAKILVSPGDVVVVGETNYSAADISFEKAGATLMRVPVDENGLDTNALEELLIGKKIRAVYLTPHHHHPTTVTLNAQRRMQLLDLAQKHRFAILEDDYDYDFHYDHAPILPLASHDSQGNVLYMGSVCKTVAPVFRVGYLIGPEQVIEEAARVRRYIDRQGDAVLEHAFARFIAQGHLEGHIRKVSREYKLRRDLAYALLKKEVGAYFDFESPKGGMAFWAVLKAPYQWATIAPKLEKLGLAIGDWTRYDRAQKGHGGIRIGFASKNPEEFAAMVHLLKQGFD